MSGTTSGRYGLRFLLLLSLLVSAAACTGQSNPSESTTKAVLTSEAATKEQVLGATAGNARYAGIKMLAPHSGCSFLSSPINFCDDRHRAEIDKVIAGHRPNFNGHYIVAELEEWPEFFQRSVVVINARSGIVYPLPIDALSGPLSSKGHSTSYGKLESSVDAKQFCLIGAVLAYRSINDGRFCFGFDGVRFTGHKTAYMASEGE